MGPPAWPAAPAVPHPCRRQPPRPLQQSLSPLGSPPALSPAPRPAGTLPPGAAVHRRGSRAPPHLAERPERCSFCSANKWKALSACAAPARECAIECANDRAALMASSPPPEADRPTRNPNPPPPPRGTNSATISRPHAMPFDLKQKHECVTSHVETLCQMKWVLERAGHPSSGSGSGSGLSPR